MAEAIDQGYYISKSGTEIQAVFNGVKFGDLHMIKYAVQRDVANVHVMGTVDAVSVAKGKHLQLVLAYSQYLRKTVYLKQYKIRKSS